MSIVANGFLATESSHMHSLSPSPSSTSINSDDAFQLSFEYIFDDQGNAVRISKNANPEEKQQTHFFTSEDEGAEPPGSRLNDLLGNERTPENPQSIASVLSRSYGSLGIQSNMISDGPPNNRSFQRAVSSSAVSLGPSRPSLLDVDRPLGRARRVPIDGKRKDDTDFSKKERDEEEIAKEAGLRRMREKDKENWMAAFESITNNNVPSVPLNTIARTHSDPSPPLTSIEQSEYQPRSQPLEPVQAHVRSRRPLSKQQRVLGAVPRPKDSLNVRTSAGSTDARSTPGSVEGSPENDLKPVRPISGGARRITKEDREKQAQEAVELREQLEREDRDRELQKIAEEKEQEEQRGMEEPQEPLHEKYIRSQSSLSYYGVEGDRNYPVVQEDKEREREPNRITRGAHQRRDSETVMPESIALPARLSPSARHVTTASSFERNPNLNTQPVEKPVERSQSLQRTSSINHPPQAIPRAQHKRSPTAPEQLNALNGNHVVQAAKNGKGQTWAIGTDVIGDVDRDLGGFGPSADGPAREKEGRETRLPSSFAPIQVTGAKAFQVNGRTYGKLDMIGKGGSSRVYRVITPSNEIYALKRVSLDRTDQETMQGYMNEIALLRRLDGNDRIIRLIESEVKGGSKGHLMLVMECGEVDLSRLISARQSTPLDMVWVSYYWKQMLEAVHVIHEEKIVHSDLKPANFVLVKGELKLIDFGIANAIANDTTNIQRDHQIGTVNYMSPESIEVAEGNTRLKVGRASDIWSLGCILYQMIYGFPPFHQLSVLQKMRVIPDPSNVIEFPPEAVPIVPQPRNVNTNGAGSTPPKKLYHLARSVPLEVIETLRSCLMKNPKDRETIPQLLSAGWLHPKGRSGELNLAPDEVIIDRDLLKQVVTWAFSVGMTTGMPQPEALEETLNQTLAQLQQCARRR
ncbi:hypothetical protein Clacol_005979 [Clathrus columnatus]|uniref:Protein kinase domain-containing protein n=1 Tax=Clathrus columnatus TaxID=1419009 RepID=A0AAV5AFJ4_9AGAM|nr:hypothetical protein Clacol_005979 [Clathrus columnatus]